MRAYLTFLVVAVAVGVVLAGTPAPKTHEMTVQVVSVDEKAKTITIKDDKGEEKTAPVLGDAVAQLKTVKAGEKVTLTCQDNEKGEHEGVIAIKPAKPAAK